MNSLNAMLDQEMSAQFISKRENLGKGGEIFTIRFAENQPVFAANLQTEFKDSIVRCRADTKHMDIDECGPDLFFERWDFVDGPMELELD